jgi:hypothetical protein
MKLLIAEHEGLTISTKIDNQLSSTEIGQGDTELFNNTSVERPAQFNLIKSGIFTVLSKKGEF